MDAIRARIDALPAELAPLADVARGLLDRPGEVSADGVLRLGHRPWVAPENYAVTLYPGLSTDALTRYAGRFGLDVPAVYGRVLAAVNGAFLFGMGLAGVPGSMLGSPPLLDRTRLQCHDLGGTATLSAGEYRKLPAGAFAFGWRHYSFRENVGYFVVGDRILCLRKSGRVVGEWGGFADFLRDELPASAALDEKLHPSGSGAS
ncbi:hypothetical protein J0H58_35545 [bacterium]|nr:hypothetical protein [bacterium]